MATSRRWAQRVRDWPARVKIASAILGAALAGGGAFAASNWVVGLAAGSTGEAQAATIGNVSISAVSGGTNLLYPGGSGDVVVDVTNPNPYPVTVTAVQLPANTADATGYTTSDLGSAASGCSAATPSTVTWAYATSSSGTSHTLTSPVTVPGSGSLEVVFQNDATMALSAPAACAGVYFSMPSLTGITASGYAATASSNDVVTGWTS